MLGSDPVPVLMCGFCLVLPGRSQGDDAVAWTVVNGTAVCRRHLGFAVSGLSWREACEWVFAWERCRKFSEAAAEEDHRTCEMFEARVEQENPLGVW